MPNFHFDLRNVDLTRASESSLTQQRIEKNDLMIASPAIASAPEGKYVIALEFIPSEEGNQYYPVLKLLQDDSESLKVIDEIKVKGDILSGTFSEDSQFFAFSEIKDGENSVNTITIYDISAGSFKVHNAVPVGQLDNDRHSIFFSSDTVNPILVGLGNKVVFFSNTTSQAEEITSKALQFDSNRIHDAVLIEGNRIFVKCANTNNPDMYAYRIAALPTGIRAEAKNGRNHLCHTSQVGMTQDGQYLYTVDVQQKGDMEYDHGIALFDPNTSDTTIAPISYFPLYFRDVARLSDKAFYLSSSKDSQQLACIYRDADNKMAVFEITADRQLSRKAKIPQLPGKFDRSIMYSPDDSRVFVTQFVSMSGEVENPIESSAINFWDTSNPTAPKIFHSKTYASPECVIYLDFSGSAVNRAILAQSVVIRDGQDSGEHSYGCVTVPVRPAQSLTTTSAVTFFQEDRTEGALAEPVKAITFGKGE